MILIFLKKKKNENKKLKKKKKRKKNIFHSINFNNFLYRIILYLYDN